MRQRLVESPKNPCCPFSPTISYYRYRIFRRTNDGLAGFWSHWKMHFYQPSFVVTCLEKVWSDPGRAEELEELGASCEPGQNLGLAIICHQNHSRLRVSLIVILETKKPIYIYTETWLFQTWVI